MNEKEILLEKLNKDIGLVLQWLGEMAIDEIWIRKKSKYDHPALKMEQVPKCNIETVLGVLEATAKYMHLEVKGKNATPAPDVPAGTPAGALVEAVKKVINNTIPHKHEMAYFVIWKDYIAALEVALADHEKAVR